MELTEQEFNEIIVFSKKYNIKDKSFLKVVDSLKEKKQWEERELILDEFNLSFLEKDLILPFNTFRDILEFQNNFDTMFENKLSEIALNKPLFEKTKIYLANTKESSYHKIIVTALREFRKDNLLPEILKWLNFSDEMIEKILLVKKQELVIVSGLTASGRTTLLEALGYSYTTEIRDLRDITKNTNLLKIHSSKELNFLKILHSELKNLEIKKKMGIIYIELINNKPAIETHFL